MSEDRSSAPRRPAAREYPQGEVKLDVARATEELKRFVNLAIHEMGLALEYDVSSPSDSGETAIVVAFRGADEELLLERNAELLLALEHVGHRWLRLDQRMHDRVRFDCGDYRATRLEELKLSARVARAASARNRPAFPL
jgi:predicted RNA-binding protein Jag